MKKLKPCPFCGFKTRLFLETESIQKTMKCWCESCGASAGQFVKTEKEAIENWNTRTESAWEMYRRLRDLILIKGADRFLWARLNVCLNYPAPEAIAIMQQIEKELTE